jgi:hypothetical protein
MKTKLFIALLLISTITIAQAKKQQIIKADSSMKVHIKIDEIKGESNDNKKSARYVKIDDVKGESNDTSTLVVEGAITNTNARRRGDVTMKDVTLDKQQKSNKRRRVVVAKSNKQGDPDANKK